MERGVSESDLYDEFIEEDSIDECMSSQDGQCGLAGTEWCDLECPYREHMFRKPIARHQKRE